MKHWHAVLGMSNKADKKTDVCFSTAVTLVISKVDDRYQKGQTAYRSESWTLRFAACDLLCFQPDFEPTRDSGRGFMWRSAVHWVSLLLIPPLFPAHNKARPPYKDRVCQICDITLISVHCGGSLPAPSPAPLRGTCFQSQR